MSIVSDTLYSKKEGSSRSYYFPAIKEQVMDLTIGMKRKAFCSNDRFYLRCLNHKRLMMSRFCIGKPFSKCQQFFV